MNAHSVKHVAFYTVLAVSPATVLNVKEVKRTEKKNTTP